MKLKEKKKQQFFMSAYQPVHTNFVRFCKARAHGIMPYEDLVNETVLRAYQHWDEIRNKETFLYFLFTTARNILLNSIRKKSEFSLPQQYEQHMQTQNHGEQQLEINYLYEQLAKLSEQKREALILFEINGFSIREIATIQESTESAVKVMLSRARKELRELMQDEPEMEEVLLNKA